MLEYLEHQAAPKTNTQQIIDVAGSSSVPRRVDREENPVLSGGERARLVLAGLLLKQHNVLVLDEPGNHLDVDTVEALADALTRYRGTVIFTSHDRHFMNRVATHVIEVRTGRVASYPASYDDYVYRVQNEIDKGHREAHTVASPGKPNSSPAGASATGGKSSGRSDRDSQKKLKAVERKIAKLDDEKRSTADALLTVTETAEAKRLQAQLANLTAELATLEEQWLALSEDLDAV